MHRSTRHTPVRRADIERRLLCSAVSSQHPFARSLVHWLCCPRRRAGSPQNNWNAGLCSAPRECQHQAGALRLAGASANLRYVELLVCEIVIILPFICASSQQRKRRRATFKLDKIPVPSDSPKLVLLVKMLVVDIALFWPLPPYKNLL